MLTGPFLLSIYGICLLTVSFFVKEATQVCQKTPLLYPATHPRTQPDRSGGKSVNINTTRLKSVSRTKATHHQHTGTCCGAWHLQVRCGDSSTPPAARPLIPSRCPSLLILGCAGWVLQRLRQGTVTKAPHGDNTYLYSPLFNGIAKPDSKTVW